MSALLLFRPRPIAEGEPTDPPPVPGSSATGKFRLRKNREINQYAGYIMPDEPGSTHRQRPR
jgi:hypothetical protein